MTHTPSLCRLSFALTHQRAARPANSTRRLAAEEAAAQQQLVSLFACVGISSAPGGVTTGGPGSSGFSKNKKEDMCIHTHSHTHTYMLWEKYLQCVARTFDSDDERWAVKESHPVITGFGEEWRSG